ncbi:hypothetical protein NDS46_24270 [Paenibacillus thiaminolyticus]|uniref:hypothetical protein n=1 Tax=Paenibacillus thiaminolyticus TaxID=49283 RepID=UPI00232E5D70|nr:hypothetical protein [Paenibacillus thiaminolyticus]WCF07404.1 hypothetical protein NDS46_24270 [Paenibacillus thiaminolyticus]
MRVGGRLARERGHLHGRGHARGRGIRVGKGEAQSLQKWRYCSTIQLGSQFHAIQIFPESCEKGKIPAKQHQLFYNRANQLNSCKNASNSPSYGTYPVYIPKKMYFCINYHETPYFGE